ncbi:Putative amidohydrolase (aminocarboxymuconate-semialdehyde decarboxylase) [Mycobacteroides abscessus subsp. abscessus]|nr:Putative amidohydrolase (aminocarboxymuconate-semialdehyde decarboxylase) [Mycobacteroides abscessus subsp. abscessus]
MHPAGCGAESSLITDHSLTWSVGAPIEDTVAIMHLIVAGIPSRYPDMKIVTCHLGGALPMVSDFPYQAGPRYVSSATYIEEGLSAEDASAILDHNGAELLGLTALKSLSPQ